MCVNFPCGGGSAGADTISTQNRVYGMAYEQNEKGAMVMAQSSLLVRVGAGFCVGCACAWRRPALISRYAAKPAAAYLPAP